MSVTYRVIKQRRHFTHHVNECLFIHPLTDHEKTCVRIFLLYHFQEENQVYMASFEYI